MPLARGAFLFQIVAFMDSASAHPDDPHHTHRGSWLRAAVLGGNDGIISVTSLMIGVASATPDGDVVMISGVAGLVAGALSMAAGEYISVSSQADLETADIARERRALEETPRQEFAELVEIYRGRGLTHETACQVASELTALDPLEAHLRDEVGIVEEQRARPFIAAIASGTTFSLAAALPLATALIAPPAALVAALAITAIIALALLGALGAKAGAAPVAPAMLRVVVWGVFAMALTALIGSLFGVAA
jgi:VIT1/CCC1 family predicted Fe2+/Mn2+ transporter